MNIRQAYLTEIGRETNNTRKMLRAIRDEHLPYQPHERSMSLGRPAGHIVALHNRAGSALGTDKLDFHKDYHPLHPDTAQELRGAPEAGYAANIAQTDVSYRIT